MFYANNFILKLYTLYIYYIYKKVSSGLRNFSPTRVSDPSYESFLHTTNQCSTIKLIYERITNYTFFSVNNARFCSSFNYGCLCVIIISVIVLSCKIVTGEGCSHIAIYPHFSYPLCRPMGR